MVVYTTQKGDILDYICWKHYGTDEYIEEVLKANPSIAEYGYEFPAGVKIELPVIEKADKVEIQLWD